MRQFDKIVLKIPDVALTKPSIFPFLKGQTYGMVSQLRFNNVLRIKSLSLDIGI